MQSILPSSEVIRDAFIAYVDVTRCGVPNADFIHPVTRSPKPLVPRRGELEDKQMTEWFIWYTLSFHHLFKTWKDEARRKKMGRGGDFTACGRAPRSLMLGTATCITIITAHQSRFVLWCRASSAAMYWMPPSNFIEYVESPPACFLCPGTKYHAALGTFPTSYRSQPTMTDYP